MAATAPSLTGQLAHGTPFDWRPARGRWSLLVFGTPECQEIMSAVDRLADRALWTSAPLDVVAVALGDAVAIRQMVERLGLAVPVVVSAEIPERFEVDHTPFGVVIGPEGLVRANGPCDDEAKLQALLETAELPMAALLMRVSARG